MQGGYSFAPAALACWLTGCFFLTGVLVNWMLVACRTGSRFPGVQCVWVLRDWLGMGVHGDKVWCVIQKHADSKHPVTVQTINGTLHAAICVWGSAEGNTVNMCLQPLPSLVIAQGVLAAYETTDTICF